MPTPPRTYAGREAMSLTVKIGEAKARFSELVARAAVGEETVIARGR